MLTGRPDIAVDFVLGEPAPADCARCRFPIRPVRVADRGAVVYRGEEGPLCMDCAVRIGGEPVYTATSRFICAVRRGRA